MGTKAKQIAGATLSLLLPFCLSLNLWAEDVIPEAETRSDKTAILSASETVSDQESALDNPVPIVVARWYWVYTYDASGNCVSVEFKEVQGHVIDDPILDDPIH